MDKMTVRDLMKMVCLHSYQKSLYFAALHNSIIPNKEAYCQSMLKIYTEHHTFSMDDNNVCIGWNSDIYDQKGFIKEADLDNEVKDGYWVYTIFTSTDDILFERFNSKTEAFKHYQQQLKSFKSNRREHFTGVVDALFIDTYTNTFIPSCTTKI